MHRFPRVDVFLASAPATAWAASAAAEQSPLDSPVRFFAAPFHSFEIGGAVYFLTPPDALAILSASILVIRFAAWGLAPFLKRNKDRN